MKYVTFFLAFFAALFAPLFAFAADHTTAINGAFTDANTNVAAVITGIVTLAAVVTGASLIYRWLTK